MLRGVLEALFFKDPMVDIGAERVASLPSVSYNTTARRDFYRALREYREAMILK
jgi:hypothetical protein